MNGKYSYLHNTLQLLIKSTHKCCEINGGYTYKSGPGRSVDIAIGYGVDGSGIESRWGRDIPPWVPPRLL